MRKKVWKKWPIFVLCFALLFGAIPVQAEETIRHSTVDYDAIFRNANQIYIGNKQAVEWKVGAKYFLHYTVTNVTENETNQSGMIVTKDQYADFPYLKGGMHYASDLSLCEKGWTYLFRFEVTKDGLKYVAGKAKGEESSYIQFPYVEGEIKTKAPYFGVWMTGTEGGKLSAELRHIRCYDEYGNDLGICAPKASEIEVSEMNPMDVDHSYSFSVDEVACLAFGNERFTKSDVITLEYTVKNVEAKDVSQSGAEFTNTPTAYYPHEGENGYLNFDLHKKSTQTKLLSEGASYLVRFERGEKTFHVFVRRTLANGAVDYFSFENFAGTYNKKFGYVAMWIGEECKVTADFVNVKCYDGEGNNLAVQTNKKTEVIHYGDLEDYSPCAAMYYCKENQNILTLNLECDITRTVEGKTETENGVYSIRDGILKAKIGEKEQEFVYAYEYIKDDAGNKYFRLRNRKATFVSQKIGGETLSTQMINQKTGFKIEQPTKPDIKGKTFVQWVDGTGKTYDFNAIATESTTLYAEWEEEPNWETTAVVGGDNVGFDVIVTSIICVLLVVGTIVASIWYVRKRRGFENN